MKRLIRRLRSLIEFIKPLPTCRKCRLLHAEAIDIDCGCPFALTGDRRPATTQGGNR